MLLVISGTHLHSLLARAVFVTIDGQVFFKLLKAMCGPRDVGATSKERGLCDEFDGIVTGQVRHPRWIQPTCRDECFFEAHTACLMQLFREGRGERWEFEADPRQVEIQVSQLGLSDECKAV